MGGGSGPENFGSWTPNVSWDQIQKSQISSKITEKYKSNYEFSDSRWRKNVNWIMANFIHLIRGFWPYRRQFNRNQALNHRKYVIGLKILMETQEIIIYRLVKRNPTYHKYFQILICWAGFGRKMGVVTTQA